MAERLAEIAATRAVDLDRPVDRYGSGIVTKLESRLAELLGKPAALWFPTGVMAQQAVLRVWAERAGTDRVAVHPMHHTQVNEEDAFTKLAGLRPVFPTTQPRHPTAGELRETPGPLAAAVLELPMQELGYVLPSWEELRAFAAVARNRGIPLHLDGARLWESRRHLGHDAADIARLADSVFVSLYKGVGALSGAAVVADVDIVAAALPWRTRFGGNVYTQFPAVASALDGLDRRLARIDDWSDHAQVIAAGLRGLPGVRVTPDPPHINEFWVYCDLPAEALNRAVLAELEQSGSRWIHGWWEDASTGGSIGEVVVRDPGLEWSADDVSIVGRRVLARAKQFVDRGDADSTETAE